MPGLKPVCSCNRWMNGHQVDNGLLLSGVSWSRIPPGMMPGMGRVVAGEPRDGKEGGGQILPRFPQRGQATSQQDGDGQGMTVGNLALGPSRAGQQRTGQVQANRRAATATAAPGSAINNFHPHRLLSRPAPSSSRRRPALRVSQPAARRSFSLVVEPCCSIDCLSLPRTTRVSLLSGRISRDVWLAPKRPLLPDEHSCRSRQETTRNTVSSSDIPQRKVFLEKRPDSRDPSCSPGCEGAGEQTR